MAITKSFDLHCDVCEDATLPQVIADSVADARREARTHGWARSGRGDVCPDCKGRRSR